MIIIESYKEEAEAAESEVSRLKEELQQLKSKLCPTCGQIMPQGLNIYNQSSTTRQVLL